MQQFLSRPNPAVIGTLADDGSPHTAATWYLWENGQVVVNMDEGRKRLEHMRADPRVSITVLGEDSWYQQVTMRGRVDALEDDTDLAVIDRLSRHYMGDAYSQRDRGRVTARIDVESWYGWNGGQSWNGGRSWNG